MVTIRVENSYTDGHESEVELVVPAPGATCPECFEDAINDDHEHVCTKCGFGQGEDDALEDFWETCFQHTGDGHYTRVYEATGERLGSCYTVTIIKADDETLVGLSNEWLD
jgi:transcription initiation factor TFIIIB Brf1 subunit/transcription initiation factor TFIIB